MVQELWCVIRMTWHKTGRAISINSAMGKAECSWRWAINIQNVSKQLSLCRILCSKPAGFSTPVCFPCRLLGKGWQLYCCSSVVGEQLSPVKYRTGCSISVLIFWVLGNRTGCLAALFGQWNFSIYWNSCPLPVDYLREWKPGMKYQLVFSSPFKKMQQIAAYSLRKRSFTSGILPILDCGLGTFLGASASGVYFAEYFAL